MDLAAIEALALAERANLAGQIVLTSSIKGNEGWAEFSPPVQVQITGEGFLKQEADRLLSYFYVRPVSEELSYRPDMAEAQIVLAGYTYLFEEPTKAALALNDWCLLDGRRHLDLPIPGV